MSKRDGWTLVEMCVVIASVAMMSSLLLPSFTSARERARLLACAVRMHEIHTGLMSHAAANDFRLPPFSFSDFVSPSLPVSGHWGGCSQPTDPQLFGFKGAKTETWNAAVNLWTLVEECSIAPGGLICPSGPRELRKGNASHFPYTSKQSSYCLRFPYSKDLFRESRGLQYFKSGRLLDVYSFYKGGGAADRLGLYYQTVPLVRIDRRYRTALTDLSGLSGDGVYDVGTDVMLSDLFWWDAYEADTPSTPQLRTYPVRAERSHGDIFNVLTGSGAVRTIRDGNNVIADNSNLPGQNLPDDEGLYHASRAETIWDFFDNER